MTIKSEIPIEKQKELLDQIKKESKEYQYYVYDWDVDTVYKKFTIQDGLDQELFIPAYQRNFTWNKERQSKFIESLFMNLPIPFVFLNRMDIDTNESWLEFQIEIIDWSQRIRTLKAFIEWELQLSWLEYITTLNGVYFSELPLAIQRKFKMMPIRAVVFSDLPLAKRKEMFKRINSSADELTPQEKRKGAFWGVMYNLLTELSEDPLFKKLCPLSRNKENREEWPELVLRYFAYKERFNEYNQNVENFLNDYIKDKNKNFDCMNDADVESNIELMKKDFFQMLNFVNTHIPYGFCKKNEKTWKYGNVVSSRTYFESIAIGVWLAQNTSNQLNVNWLEDLLNSEEFRRIVSSDSANNKSKFEGRINIIKDFLLKH